MSNPGERSVRWLHLSDLHLDADTHWRWHWLKDTLFPDLKRLHPKAGPWDLVIFTGDLSMTGRLEEFLVVDEALNDLWSLFEKLQPGHVPLLLAVPGNHDLVRPSDVSARGPLFLDELEIASMYQQSNQSGSVAARCKAAFLGYQSWWESSSLRPSKLQSGLFPGDFTASLKLRNVRLGIVGINSATLQLTAGDYEGRLWVHPRQFYAACKGEDGPSWARAHDVCFLLTHHPPTWLDADSLELFDGCIKDQGRFALHLCGHMHKLETRIASQNGLPLQGYWQASSLLGEESYEFPGGRAERPSYGYAAGELLCNGGQSWVRFWPRVAHCHSDKAKRFGWGQWHMGPANDRIALADDDASDYFPVGRSGIAVEESHSRWFDIAIDGVRHPGLLPSEQRQGSIAKGRNPYVVAGALPADSPVFVGRQNLLRDVIDALTSHDRPPSLSLLGEQHIGKSSFLNQVFNVLSAEPGLVVVKGTVEAWEDPSPALFFDRLHRALGNAFNSPVSAQTSYDGLKQLLRAQAQRFRFVLMLDDFEELPKNPKFGRDFYSNLRALGDGPEYGLGFLICSRQALHILCKASHDLMASAFWNIFTAKCLGLLGTADVAELINGPWQCSLDHSAPDTLLLNRLAGRHPAFLQKVLDQVWRSAHEGRQPDEVEITRSLGEHFNDLWDHRDEQERTYLGAIVRGERATCLAVSRIRDLQERGILIGEDKCFCSSFEEFVREKMPTDR